MALLNVQQVDLTGVKPTFNTCNAAGDTFYNNGQTYIHIKNGDTSSKTVTVLSPGKCNQGFQHDLSITIPANEERVVGFFIPTGRFNTDEKVSLTYSAVTSLTIAILRF